jgi:t-SNARE complex subunit (syntaxin)
MQSTTQRDLLKLIDIEVSNFTPQEISEMPTLNTVIHIDNSDIQDFLKRLSKLDNMFESLNKNVSDIPTLYTKLMTSYKQQDTQNINNSISRLIDSINLTAKTVRNEIKAINKENKHITENFDLRMRNAHYSRLNQKFVKFMIYYNETVHENKNIYVNSLKKSCKLVDETIDNVHSVSIDTTSDTTQLSTFANSIFSGRPIQSITEDIKDRHTEINKLEKSLKNLHEIFLDVAVIVESQSETIDSIEHSVESSHNNIVKSNTNFQQAREFQTSARRKKICICGWTLFIIGIIVLVVILTL